MIYSYIEVIRIVVVIGLVVSLVGVNVIVFCYCGLVVLDVVYSIYFG